MVTVRRGGRPRDFFVLMDGGSTYSRIEGEGCKTGHGGSCRGGLDTAVVPCPRPVSTPTILASHTTAGRYNITIVGDFRGRVRGTPYSSPPQTRPNPRTRFPGCLVVLPAEPTLFLEPIRTNQSYTRFFPMSACARSA